MDTTNILGAEQFKQGRVYLCEITEYVFYLGVKTVILGAIRHHMVRCQLDTEMANAKVRGQCSARPIMSDESNEIIKFTVALLENQNWAADSR